MSTYKKLNPFSKQNNNTGFSSNSDNLGGRFINKDGSYNLVKEGMTFWKRFSIFHNALNLPQWKFITLIVLFYIAINLVFTMIYFWIGPGELDGLTGRQLANIQTAFLFQHANIYHGWIWTCQSRGRYG
jgi:inward rectifier potassium channel